MGDIIFNPNDGLFYGIDTNESLWALDVAQQTWTNMGVVTGLPDSGYGSAYSTNDGTLYIGDNTNGNIYTVDVSARTASFFGNGPTAAGNDGAKVLSVAPDGTPIGLDNDGDGIFDHLDIDSDNDGITCLLYTSPSPRDGLLSRMPSSA